MRTVVLPPRRLVTDTMRASLGECPTLTAANSRVPMSHIVPEMIAWWNGRRRVRRRMAPSNSAPARSTLSTGNRSSVEAMTPPMKASTR